MAAIITDQIRILNAKNFLAGVTSTSNAYYSFIGLPNPTDYQSDWDTSPPAPKDNFGDPTVIELTFERNPIIIGDEPTLPHELDMRNNPLDEDIELFFKS